MLNTVIGIVAGAVVTLLVSRYYFVRSVQHRLTVYVHSVSRVFSGVNPDLRRALSVTFRQQPVADLAEFIFLVANEGSNSIRNMPQPMWVILPDGMRLVDASVAYVYPEGREISLNVDGEGGVAACMFSLLNPGEFFLLKLLVDGQGGPLGVRFAVTAEGLPPKVKPQYGSYSTPDMKASPWGAFFFGASMLAVAAGLAATIFLAWDAPSPFLPSSDAFTWGPVEVAALAACGVVALLATACAVIGGGMLLTSAFGGQFPPSPSYAVPSQWRHSRHMVLLEDGSATRIDHLH